MAKKYFELQKKHHPDFCMQAGGGEQKEVLKKSSPINKAFKILQQPGQSIQYLLYLKGLEAENKPLKLPAIFLMEMLELSEMLDEQEPENFKKKWLH